MIASNVLATVGLVFMLVLLLCAAMVIIVTFLTACEAVSRIEKLLEELIMKGEDKP